jgi:anti-sigma-K factor RskA
MSENEKQNPADLAGAYALDALSPEEAAEFKAYLAGSEEAKAEAAELSDTAVALGLATPPVEPSPALKASLMAKLTSTPQLPRQADSREGTSASPQATQAPDAAANDGATTIGNASANDGAPANTVSDSGGASVSHLGDGPAERRAKARWFSGPAVLLLSAAAAVALFFGGVLAGQAFSSNRFDEQQATALAEINAAPDVQRASTVTADGHPATLVWSGELGRSALLIEDLPPLPADKDYQLWYMNSAGAFSGGTFDSSGQGTVWRVLEGAMKAGDQVGVTVEPNGGSEEPTTDPILAIQS